MGFLCPWHVFVVFQPTFSLQLQPCQSQETMSVRRSYSVPELCFAVHWSSDGIGFLSVGLLQNLGGLAPQAMLKAPPVAAWWSFPRGLGYAGSYFLQKSVTARPSPVPYGLVTRSLLRLQYIALPLFYCSDSCALTFISS